VAFSLLATLRAVRALQHNYDAKETGQLRHVIGRRFALPQEPRDDQLASLSRSISVHLHPFTSGRNGFSESDVPRGS
jgi:hypothetical protein